MLMNELEGAYRGAKEAQQVIACFIITLIEC